MSARALHPCEMSASDSWVQQRRGERTHMDGGGGASWKGNRGKKGGIVHYDQEVSYCILYLRFVSYCIGVGTISTCGVSSSCRGRVFLEAARLAQGLRESNSCTNRRLSQNACHQHPRLCFASGLMMSSPNPCTEPLKAAQT